MTNLRAGDHADGSNISIGDTEEHHDDDVGGVTLKQHGGHPSIVGVHIAEEEEGQEDESEDGEAEGDPAADLAWLGDHDEAGQEPAEVVANVEQQEAGHRDVEGASPS